MLRKVLSPPITAALASLLPVMLPALWKNVSPGYHCNIRNPQSVWHSPCFAASLAAAYSIGWIVGVIANCIDDARQPGAGAAGVI